MASCKSTDGKRNPHSSLFKQDYATLDNIISSWSTTYVLNRANVIAVVQRITHPLYTTRNNKYCVKFKIIDESVGQTGFFVSCFNKKSDILADIKAGDILCINHMKIEEYNDVPDGRVFELADVVIFKREDLSPISVFDDLQVPDEVRKRVSELKDWSEQLNSCPEWVTALGSIRGPGEYHIVCQVVDVTCNGACVLHVTDGSVICRPGATDGSAPASASAPTSASAPASASAPVSDSTTSSFRLAPSPAYCQALPLTPYTLPCHIGHLVTEITVNKCPNYFESLKRGSIVHLCNVKTQPLSDGDKLRLTFEPECPPCLLTPNHNLVKDINERLNILKELLELNTLKSQDDKDGSSKEHEKRLKRRREEKVEFNMTEQENKIIAETDELQSMSGNRANKFKDDVSTLVDLTDSTKQKDDGKTVTVFTEILIMDETGSNREDVQYKDITGMETYKPKLQLERDLSSIPDRARRPLLVSLVSVFPDPLYPLNWVTGECLKGCDRRFFYPDLYVEEPRPNTKLLVRCPECESIDKNFELHMGLHLELQVVDMYGEFGRLAVSGREAEKFLHCSLNEFVRDEELRRSRAELLLRHSVTVEPERMGSRPLLAARVIRFGNIFAVVDTALKLPSSA